MLLRSIVFIQEVLLIILLLSGLSLYACVTALTWGDPSNTPVLLCQGRLDTCSTFRPLVRRLSKNRFYVSVEMPGNGFSTPYPHGCRLHTMDLLPPLLAIVDHFKWEKFAYIGHSLGALTGNFYNHTRPDQITRFVQIDPQPMYLKCMESFKELHDYNYPHFYGDELHSKVTAGIAAAPKMLYERIKEKLMAARRIDADSADQILERCLEHADDGLYRITYDQRQKFFSLPSFLFGSLKRFYTEAKTPTLAILASESVANGSYSAHSFAMDDGEWLHKNYRHAVVEGNHDIHINNVDKVAELIETFLEE